MYLRKVHIQNIRCIADYTWQVNEGEEAGWHVLIGDNGSGKSTFLQAISLDLVGQSASHPLLTDLNRWLMIDKESGSLIIKVAPHKQLDKPAILTFSVKPQNALPDYLAYPFSLEVTIKQRGQVVASLFSDVETIRAYIENSLAGWFSAAYGPFRRFTGGENLKYQQLFDTKPRLTAHLSVFREDVALTEGILWLRNLDHKRLEGKTEGKLLDAIKTLINQGGFLPHNVRLNKVSSEGVEFVDSNGSMLAVEELSDGYRSILSLTFDLIHQMARFYTPEQLFGQSDQAQIIAPGVVLIDEVDAHLHPSWQRNIGPWFKKHFPNIQFIVTTHSPLVCQAATTVWRLPRPGSDDKGGRVTDAELDRLLYGDVLEAYSTGLFGDTSRADNAKQRLRRLAELNLKELHKGLNKKEKAEQEKLRAAMPTTAHRVEA